MFLYLFYLTILLYPSHCIYSWNQNDIPNLAYVIVPVADATIKPLQLLDLQKKADQLYKELPFAREKGEYSCARFHQLLFNEVVRVKKELKDEVECELLNLFYEGTERKKQRSFWILKKNIKLLADLPLKDIAAIPPAYTEDLNRSLKNILTLTWPWADPVTKKTYSAGTRFVRANHLDTEQAYGIKVLDSAGFESKLSLVPHKYAVISYPTGPDNCIKSFMNLLKQWAGLKSFIPYVWGGTSFIQTYETNTFALIEAYRFGEKVFFWTRPHSTVPVTGLECSGLIFRIAQICGMPYYFKNTTSIARNLEPLKPSEVVSEGDIIWYLGHVLIISDIKKNKIIESVGYLTGYGKVHEINISRVFKNINSIDDLTKAYVNNKILERIDIAGRVVRTISGFQILKLGSIWKK